MTTASSRQVGALGERARDVALHQVRHVVEGSELVREQAGVARVAVRLHDVRVAEDEQEIPGREHHDR